MSLKERYYPKESDLIRSQILHLKSNRLITSYQPKDSHNIQLASQSLKETHQTHLINPRNKNINTHIPYYTNDSCNFLYGINILQNHNKTSEPEEHEQLIRLNLMEKSPKLEMAYENLLHIISPNERFVTHSIMNCVNDKHIYLQGYLDRGNGSMIILEVDLTTFQTKTISLLYVNIEMDITDLNVTQQR